MLQWSDLEPGSKPAATTTGDITSDTGRQLGQSALNLEDLLDHHDDGFRGATVAQLFWMVELMNPERIPNVTILVGTNNISRSSDEKEVHGIRQWELQRL